MDKPQKNIIAFVMGARVRALDEIKHSAEKNGVTYRTMLIRDSRLKRPVKMLDYDIVVECDFGKPSKIAAALLPYQNELLAITCRFEQSIARFAAVIPHVPYLHTPTTESLTWATDKYEMRKRLRLFDAKNTPVFTWVKSNTKKERTRVIEKVKFPMIVKPTNLAGSLFVTICYHEEDLEKTLRTAFRKIRVAYKKDSRLEEPKIIAEEYMDGDLYSLDSYVNNRGEVEHCPLVRQRTAKELGQDDFYNYLQITPTALKQETVNKAREVAEHAIHALGLRSVTAHTELMKVDDEWKIIEIGPRPGGFRDILHKLSCDIDHTMNDIAVRIPKKIVIPKKCKGYAAYYKYVAPEEGTIMETKGIKKIEELKSFHSITVNKKVGDRAVFAKNGGRPIFTVVLYNAERSELLADIRRIEQSVSVTVGNGKEAAKKSAVRKVAKKKKEAKKKMKNAAAKKKEANKVKK